MSKKGYCDQFIICGRNARPAKFTCEKCSFDFCKGCFAGHICIDNKEEVIEMLKEGLCLEKPKLVRQQGVYVSKLEAERDSLEEKVIEYGKKTEELEELFNEMKQETERHRSLSEKVEIAQRDAALASGQNNLADDEKTAELTRLLEEKEKKLKKITKKKARKPKKKVVKKTKK